MSKGHGKFCEDGCITILLLGENNGYKCSVGNKIATFDYFLPGLSTFEEISLEKQYFGIHWLTVVNIPEESQSLPKIEAYMDSSSGCPYMIVFVLQPDVSQTDVDMFTSFKQRFGKSVVENTVILVVRNENTRSAKPNNVTDGNLKEIFHQCPRKVCYFNKNMKESDFIKQLMKCWKSAPEMQVNKYDRPHMATFVKDNISQPQKEMIQEHISGMQEVGVFPSVSGYRQERPRTDGIPETGGFSSISGHRQERPRTDGIPETGGFSSISGHRQERPRTDGMPETGSFSSISGHRQERPRTDGEDQTAIRKNSMTIILLGQTGSGKSATGNTILRKCHFESHASSVPVTQECQTAEETVCGIMIRVIDTPDFFDEGLKNKYKHIKRCKELAQPGPDAYVLVMELGRFTDGEREIVQNIQKVFGEDVVRETIILFTGKEKLRGKTLTEYIQNTDGHLQQLIQLCGSRCLAFNNNDHKDHQFQKLIEVILEMKRENGNIDILEQYPYHKEEERKDCRIQ